MSAQTSAHPNTQMPVAPPPTAYHAPAGAAPRCSTHPPGHRCCWRGRQCHLRAGATKANGGQPRPAVGRTQLLGSRRQRGAPRSSLGEGCPTASVHAGTKPGCPGALLTVKWLQRLCQDCDVAVGGRVGQPARTQGAINGNVQQGILQSGGRITAARQCTRRACTDAPHGSTAPSAPAHHSSRSVCKAQPFEAQPAR